MESKLKKQSRAKRTFTDEFRAEAVSLVLKKGRTIAQVARELALTQSTLGRWVEQVRADARKSTRGRLTTEKKDPSESRRERGPRDEASKRRQAARYLALAVLRRVLVAQGVPDPQHLPSLAEIMKGVGAPDVPDEVVRMRHLLSDETDRGCVLIATGYLDEQLAHLLRAFFIEDPKLAEGLLESDRAIGTFSTRIKLCEALGLLGHETCRNLELVRKIRNEFAHEWEHLSFESDSVRNRVDAITVSLPDGLKGTRKKFTAAAMALSAAIHVAIVRTVRRQPPQAAAKGASPDFMKEVFVKEVFEVLRSDFPSLLQEAAAPKARG